jgi:hypothetical protein
LLSNPALRYCALSRPGDSTSGNLVSDVWSQRTSSWAGKTEYDTLI